MCQSNFRPIYIFNNDAYILEFCAQVYPLIFFFLNSNPFNMEDLLYFQHSMQIFVFAPNQWLSSP